MSYIRPGHKMKYVVGESSDYVFERNCPNPEEDYIEDYGQLSNEGIVEIIARQLAKLEKPMLHEYLVRNLAKKLKVELKKEKYGEWEW